MARNQCVVFLFFSFPLSFFFLEADIQDYSPQQQQSRAERTRGRMKRYHRIPNNPILTKHEGILLVCSSLCFGASPFVFSPGRLSSGTT